MGGFWHYSTIYETVHKYELSDFVRLGEMQNALQLHMLFFFLIFCQPYPGFRNCKSVFLILKISQFGGSKSCDHLVSWSKSMTLWSPGLVRSREKMLYLHYRNVMATKLGRMKTYLDGLLSPKSYESLITWSCEMAWQTKATISPLSECLWPPNLTRW